MFILRAKIALNAVICMILFIFSLIMESWLLRNVGFYRSFLQFYDLVTNIVFLGKQGIYLENGIRPPFLFYKLGRFFLQVSW